MGPQGSLFPPSSCRPLHVRSPALCQTPRHPGWGQSGGQALVERKGCAGKGLLEHPRWLELTDRAQLWRLLPPVREWRGKGGPGAGRAVPYRQGRATAPQPGEQGRTAAAAGLGSSPVTAGQKHRNKPGQRGLSVPQSPGTGWRRRHIIDFQRQLCICTTIKRHTWRLP